MWLYTTRKMLVLSSSLLLSLLVLRRSSAQTLFLDGTLYANNSAIFIDEIGEDTLSLKCHTTRPNCCKENVQGEWYYPDGSLVPTRGAGQDFYRNRDDDGYVRLNRRNNAQSPRGVYYCVLPDIRGVLTRISVFIYSPADYPEVVEHPRSLINVDPGSTVSFSVRALRSLSYQWQHNHSTINPNPSKYAGLRSDTLTVLNVNTMDAGLYSCVVGSRVVSVLSNTAQLTLLPPPLLVTQPRDVLEAERGSNAQFTVAAVGVRLSYLWQLADETLLTDGAKFVGVATSAMTIRNVQFEDAGLYVCVVSNDAGSVRSEGAMLTVSGLEEVATLNVTTAITSAWLNWSVPTDVQQGTVIYELQYYPSIFPSHAVTLNTTLTSYLVVGLIPQLHYEFRVRVYTAHGRGVWINVSSLLDRKIPPVTDLEMVVTDFSTIYVSWSPPDDLPGWNISYYYLTYKALLPNRDRPDLESTFRRKVSDGRTFMMLDATEFPVGEELMHEFEVLAALEVKGVEGIGEVKGEGAVIVSTFNYEKLPFQVMVGPIQYCIEWDVGKASKVEQVIQEAVVAAINVRCDCFLPENSIRSGVFSCRGSQAAVTYRSTVVGLNATQLIGHIQDWVGSGTTIRMDWYLMDVYSDCPVGIDELDEPEC